MSIKIIVLRMFRIPILIPKIPLSEYRIPFRNLTALQFAEKKNGESVEYTFSVTEDEYPQYNIGDYYKR